MVWIVFFFKIIKLEKNFKNKQKLDISDLRKYVKLNKFEESDKEVIWFFKILKDFDEEHVVLLFKFLGGMPTWLKRIF